jgi:hypothetical protein
MICNGGAFEHSDEAHGSAQAIEFGQSVPPRLTREYSVGKRPDVFDLLTH